MQGEINQGDQADIRWATDMDGIGSMYGAANCLPIAGNEAKDIQLGAKRMATGRFYRHKAHIRRMIR